MELKKHKVLFAVVSCIICCILYSNFALAAEPARVLILPFNIHSKDDLSFLNTGIYDMLSSRLTKKDGVVVIKDQDTTASDMPGTGLPETNLIDEKTAIKTAAGLNADYVIFGSLTLFGNSVSTNARFIDVQKKLDVVTLNEFGENRGDVLSHINLFAARINEHVFGQKEVVLQPPPVKEVKVEPAKIPEPAEKTEITKKDIKPAGIWKSRKFKEKIKSMAIGDVYGDGKNEAVFISASEVFIFRYENGSLVKKGYIKEKNYNAFLGVDVADINGNKKAEIFITSLTSKGRLNSFVLEYDGLKFNKIVPDANFYYRVLNIPGRGNILLGQKQGVIGTADEFGIDLSSSLFLPGVFELKWKQGDYEPSSRMTLPKGINIYGFSLGDVANNGQEMIVAFAKDDRLLLFNKDGDKEFRSGERYGGSEAYMEFPIRGDKQKDRFYLPQRLHITDLDRDGKNEVIAVKNHSTVGRVFSRYRSFDSGLIECMEWNNVTLKQKWKTDEITGYISDYTVGDLDNDGSSEILFSVVTKSGSIIKKQRSYIIAWRNPE